MPGIPAGKHADEVFADYARLNKLDDEQRHREDEKKRLEQRSKELLSDPFFSRHVVKRIKR